MKLTKVVEIIELNIKEADKKMPPDCKDALQISAEAVKRLQHMREDWNILPEDLLPGETPEN